jgi:mono/diheme cytochrome c family protein
VLQTLRGKAGVATFDERGIPIPATSTKDWSVHTAEAALVLIALLVALAFAAGGYVVGREHPKGGGVTTTTGTSTSGGGAITGDAKAGAALFASNGCGSCHVLAAAGSTGNVGPSLDAAKPSEALVIERETNGMGAMPSFKDRLSPQQIADIAAYVHESTTK